MTSLIYNVHEILGGGGGKLVSYGGGQLTCTIIPGVYITTILKARRQVVSGAHSTRRNFKLINYS